MRNIHPGHRDLITALDHSDLAVAGFSPSEEAWPALTSQISTASPTDPGVPLFPAIFALIRHPATVYQCRLASTMLSPAAPSF
jgi:hypothetical protein